MTTAVDLHEQINHLRHLAHDFKVLHNQVRTLAVVPGTRALRQLTPQQAPHKISLTQYEALRELAKGGATMQTRDLRPPIILTPDNTIITTTTFESLDERGLVHLDTSVPLYRGRPITVTAEGQRALAQYRSRTDATAMRTAAGRTPATTGMPTVTAKREIRR
ncbi:hypothetical protein [Streptomyces sp. NPDC048637]|uniref:hypothetical protein n=1 Tax=Streptomyces sp. NPDC048637 TaxID=3155636 RepID=UPI00343F56A2